jgi:hypothetical protein
VEEIATLLERDVRNQQRNLSNVEVTKEFDEQRWDILDRPYSSPVDLVGLDAVGKLPAPSWPHCHHVQRSIYVNKTAMNEIEKAKS